ncbi:MAG: hypothetical protein IV100_17595 [Myxococcales bacterium]|nr:hypothetical protein [Myxococcales bacterium]
MSGTRSPTGGAGEAASAVPVLPWERVRDELLKRGGAATLPQLEASTGMPLDDLVLALGQLFTIQPGHVEVGRGGDFAIVLDTGVAPSFPERRDFRLGRALLFGAFALYALIYLPTLTLGTAIMTGQASVLRWLGALWRGRPEAAGPASLPLLTRLQAFFFGPELFTAARWDADKVALDAARLRGRTLTPLDLIAVFGHELLEARAEAARLAFQHGGGVEHEDGFVWYTFPGLPSLRSEAEQSAAQARVASAAVDDVARRAAAATQDRLMLGLLGVNLGVSVAVIVAVSFGIFELVAGWVPLVSSAALAVWTLVSQPRRLTTRRALSRRALRAEAMRDLLLGEGKLARRLDGLARDDREIVEELVVELGGKTGVEGRWLVAHAEDAYKTAMYPLESASLPG